MKHRFLPIIVSYCVATGLIAPAAFAQDVFNPTAAGSYDWNGNNWSGNNPPQSGDNANFQNGPSGGDVVVTNANGTINFFFAHSTSANNYDIITGSGGFTSNFGLQLGSGGILNIAGNSTFGINQFMTFDLDNNGQGTLIASNGATLILRKDGNSIGNSGTMQLTAGSGLTSGYNYGQVSAFDNNSNGTIVKNDVGTGTFVGNFSGSNIQ
jgi:hypothetical protein